MNEEQPSYKVTDRRLFNSDGSPREVPPEEQPEPKSQPNIESTPAPAEASSGDRDTVDISSKWEATDSTTAANPVAAADSQPEPPSPGQQNEEAELDNAEGELPGADDPASFASFFNWLADSRSTIRSAMQPAIERDRPASIKVLWIRDS